jgi:DNA-binding NarL/FixJ family response regulator
VLRAGMADHGSGARLSNSVNGRIAVVIIRGRLGLLDSVERLMAEAGFEVIATIPTAEEALRLLGERQVDVVLIDLQIPDGLSGLVRIRAASPDAVVVALSAGGQMEADEALAAGAAACVSPSAAADDVLTAVRQAIRRSVFFSRDLARDSAMSSAEPIRLTIRELEILQLVAKGLSNSQIANRLWVTEQTVKFHLSNTYKKLGVANRTQAIRVAESHGLVTR